MNSPDYSPKKQLPVATTTVKLPNGTPVEVPMTFSHPRLEGLIEMGLRGQKEHNEYMLHMEFGHE